jgi:hypothetical protein
VVERDEELSTSQLKLALAVSMVYAIRSARGCARLEAAAGGAAHPLDPLLATPLPELLSRPPPGLFDDVGGPAPWAALLAALPRDEEAWLAEE